MNKKLLFAAASLLVAVAMGVLPVSAAGKENAAPPVALTDAGNRLCAQYSEMLKGLQAEMIAAIPTIDEPKQAALKQARAATVAAEKRASAAEQPMDKIKTAQALVEHAKFKWIAGADKGIAQAQSARKQAATEAERETANQELAKWQADKAAGIKALKERQAAWARAQADRASFLQVIKAAQAALAAARANELTAAKSILADAGPFLSSDKLDAQLVKCVVLAEATPPGLAEFAEQGAEQAALVAKLLADDQLMREMLEAGGAKAGKYGPAMQIYAGIQKASSRAKAGVFHRLALGTCLEHAVPIKLGNAVANTNAPTVADPVRRYRHYEQAYLDGELDPAFKNMTAWECRMITDCEAPDQVLAWGREMLRNYRPDHIFNPDYGWRYVGAVRTDVWYRHSQEYKDTDSLEYFQNIIKNGGICGRRAWFGRFIVKSFGIPAWGLSQVGHACLSHWTPDGWVINYGAGWQWGFFDGRSGLDFRLETQARKHPQDYLKALRAQWVGEILGEPKYDSMKPGSGGLWNSLALFEKQVIAAEAKPAPLTALGQELAEANEPAETTAMAVAKAAITDADKIIIIAQNGGITIPAAACKGAEVMRSFLGGQQMSCGGKPFSFEVELPAAGKYALAAQVVTVHDELRLPLTVNNSKNPVEIFIPYTCGHWQTTEPVAVALVQGKNVLSFQKPASSFTIKQFTLTPVK